MAMNLHLLRIFYTVAERHSFSRAAEALFITQPAVSKAVRELEQQLAVPLIERGVGVGRAARGVLLTESGQALFEHARGIFALERAASDDLQTRLQLRRGRLVVGASSTIAGYWLPEYAATFMQRFPTIELQVRAGNTQAVTRALIECETDLALVEGTVEDPRLAVTHWRDEALQIIAPVRAVAALTRGFAAGALNQQTWLMREPGSGTRAVTEQLLGRLAIVPRRAIEFASNEGIARAVAAGLGVAMLPAKVVRELVAMKELGVLRVRYRTDLLRPLFLLQLRARPASPLAAQFAASITAAPLRLRSPAR